MFKNYFKTAIRNIKRNKSYALINTLGLAVGIAACMLIFLVVQFETSFDNFHKRKKDIYRIASKFETQDGISYSGGVSFPVGAAIRIDYPHLKEVARIFKSGDDQVTIESETTVEQKKFEEDVYFAEPEFFKIFDFKWISGNDSVLKDPGVVALTRSTAEKYFGDWKSAIGKLIKHNNRKDQIYKVVAILEDVPANTDFPLGIVISFETLKNTRLKSGLTDWVSTYSGSNCFVVLPHDMDPEKFESDLVAFAKKHKPAEYVKDGYSVQALSEIHFDDRFGNYREHTFSESLITALQLIGIFLILIACVNFINLATAQAVNRAREVGVRKVLGSKRSQLVFQFMMETFIIVLIALAIAILMAVAALPFLNNLLEVSMTFSVTNIGLVLFAIATLISVTMLSGFYPAIILSGFNPINALKSKLMAKSSGGINLRRALVVMQFAIAHVLIIGMLVVVSQMKFFKNASLGFNKSQIVNVDIPGDSISRTQYTYLHDEFARNPNIQQISFSFSSPAADGNWQSDFKYDHSTKNTNFSANLKWADVDYFKTYGLQFVAGGPYRAGDTVRDFVVNETLIRKLGVKTAQEAIGKEINMWDGGKKGLIVGVIRDFNSYSLREPIAPVIMSTWKDVYQTINLRIKSGTEKETLAYVEGLWSKTYPDRIYKYSFLDETINNFYRQELQLSQLYQIFAGIAIFISCLGLYGLVAFMAVQRTKEMGIRKVLGATARNIIYLLSKEFSLLIMIAFVIGAAVAWFVMKEWLQNYTYRINIGIGIFLVALAGSMAIAWLAVGYRAIKAARANPVDNLRTE